VREFIAETSREQALSVLGGRLCAIRPKMTLMKAGGAMADARVGFLDGVPSGNTGFVELLLTICYGLGGWPEDQHRAYLSIAPVRSWAASPFQSPDSPLPRQASL
jgi:hypothetical protein